jgi:putative transposase
MYVKNDLITAIDGRRYRILTIEPGLNRGWVFCVDDKDALPEFRDIHALADRDAPKPNDVREASEAIVPTPSFEDFSTNAKRRARAAQDAIKPLIENPRIFLAEVRGPLLDKHAEETGISKTTLYRYLRLWWRNGQNLLALIQDFDGIGKSNKDSTSGRGRKAQDGRYAVFQMKPADFKHCEKAIRDHFLKGEISTLAGAHFLMRQKAYSFLDGNGDKFLLPDGEFPSIYQFRNIARTRFKLSEILRRKHGNKKFEREHGAYLGSALEECVGIGHIYELDATIADVFLVAQEDRASIIGKPTLYLIYDRWSRLIVGFYVGLENASWTGAMLAILSIATNKRQLCERYGVPYDPHDWPADGIFPQRFLGDRGEMASADSYRICEGMEATVSNTQSLIPQRKGTIECGFRLFHAQIREIVPGYEPPFNQVKRREKRYDRDASLTLDEFIAVVLNHIIAHNRHVMKGYDLSPGHVLREVPAVPLALWNDNTMQRAGALARYDYDFVRLQLLPRDTAHVTKSGIEFRRCVYEPPAGCEWLLQAKVREAFSVSCSFDYRLVDSIVVYDPKNPRVSMVCKLAGTSKNYLGYSFAEVEYIERKKLLVNFDSKADADNARAKLHQRVKAITEPAIARTKVAAKGMSRSGRRADTAAARDAERTIRRQQEAALSVPTESLPSSNVISLQEYAPAQSKPLEATSAGAPASSVSSSMSSSSPAEPIAGSSIRSLLRRKAQEKQNEQ